MALKQDRTPGANSTPESTPSHAESPSFSVNTPNTETEDAAQALEDLALGRRQYHSLGLNSEVPGSHARNASVSLRTHVSTAICLTCLQCVAPGTITSIFLGTPPPKRSVLLGTQSGNDTFLKSLPDKLVSDALVDIFLSEQVIISALSTTIINTPSVSRGYIM